MSFMATRFALVGALLFPAAAGRVAAEVDFTGFQSRCGTLNLSDRPQWWYFDPTRRAEAQDAYWNLYAAAAGVPMEWTGDDSTPCPGAVSADWRTAVYQTVNLMRYLDLGGREFFINQEDPSRLADPLLAVRASDGSLIAQDRFWRCVPGNGPLLPGGSLAPFAPGDPADAALVLALGPGAYTATVTSESGTGGVGIVEIFETNPPSP